MLNGGDMNDDESLTVTVAQSGTTNRAIFAPIQAGEHLVVVISETLTIDVLDGDPLFGRSGASWFGAD